MMMHIQCIVEFRYGQVEEVHIFQVEESSTSIGVFEVRGLLRRADTTCMNYMYV